MSILLSAHDKPNASLARAIIGCEYTIREIDISPISSGTTSHMFSQVEEMLAKLDMHGAKYAVIERSMVSFYLSEADKSGCDYESTHSVVNDTVASVFSKGRGCIVISAFVGVRSASGARSLIVRSALCHVATGGKYSVFDNAWNSFLIPDGSDRVFSELSADEYAQKSAAGIAYTFVLRTIKNHEKTGRWLESDE